MRWDVYRFENMEATLIGSIRALNAAQAESKACKKYKIKTYEERRKIIVRKKGDMFLLENFGKGR